MDDWLFIGRKVLCEAKKGVCDCFIGIGDCDLGLVWIFFRNGWGGYSNIRVGGSSIFQNHPPIYYVDPLNPCRSKPPALLLDFSQAALQLILSQFLIVFHLIFELDS